MSLTDLMNKFKKSPKTKGLKNIDKKDGTSLSQKIKRGAILGGAAATLATAAKINYENKKNGSYSL